MFNQNRNVNGGLHIYRGPKGISGFKQLKLYKKHLIICAVVTALIGVGVFIKTRFSVAATPEEYTASAAEVEEYLSTNQGASLNDIVDNFADMTIVELPAGEYPLSDNLIIDRRLILRGADGTLPKDVVIDGGSYFTDGDVRQYNNGYYMDMKHAGIMIEGVTLTHLGTGEIDMGYNEEDISVMGSAYSITMRAGTIHRSIIVDNVGSLPYNPSISNNYGTVVGLQNATLSSSLVINNGTGDTGYVEGTGKIVGAVGTSHLIGNTISHNNVFNGSIDYPSYCAVQMWDDPIAENNVIEGNVGRRSAETCALSVFMRGPEKESQYFLDAGVLYEYWIHRDTQNNYLSPYDEYLFEQKSDSLGASLTGDVGYYDYAPFDGSDLIDSGTDVFYPVIPKDLNGRSHFLGEAPDLGAIEFEETAPVFTQYPEGRVYVTPKGSGKKDGTSWANAMNGNAEGGPQNALIAAMRGKAQEVWFAEGDYTVAGRELLYIRGLSHYDQVDNFAGGVWSGL